MKIVCISDTHNQIGKINLPEADVLVHAGDITMGGSYREIRDFNDDLESIKFKFKHIVVIPGNHDHMFQDYLETARAMVTNAHVLIDQAITLDGVKFYGSPWQPWFYDWSFNFPESDLDTGIIAEKKWAEIPDNTDVLITHGPAYKMLDKVARTSKKNIRDPHVGCPELAKRIAIVKPKLHVCGHIHEGYGRVITDETVFVNAAICTLQYQPFNAPVVIEI